MARRAATDAGEDTRQPGEILALADVPWLDAPRSRLLAARADGRLPHALLLHGPEDGGQLPLALWLAHWLLCEQGGDRPCGHCASCELFLAGNHPDFHWVGIEAGASAIKVDQIRALSDKLALRSYRGASKVGLIEPADRMTISTNNALLKTLEEPPEDTVLLLSAARIDRLPATVLSRCQRIRISQPPPEQALAWLAGQSAGEDWPSLLALAAGAPIKALVLAQAGMGALATEMERALGGSGRTAAPDAFGLAAVWSKDRPAERLAWLECWLESRIRGGYGLSDAVNNNRDNALPTVRSPLNMRSAFALLDRVRDARSLLEGSLNTQLLFEDLLTAFGEALAGRPVPREGMTA